VLANFLKLMKEETYVFYQDAVSSAASQVALLFQQPNATQLNRLRQRSGG